VGCDGSPLSFRRISVAVKSILGAIDLPWNDPLWADAPINTAEFPYLYTSVSNSVFEFSLRSPDLSASRIVGLSKRDPLSSVSTYVSSRIASREPVSALIRASTYRR